MTGFWNLTNSTEISETGGEYPQVKSLLKDQHYDDGTSIFHITKLDTDKDHFIDIPEFVLSRGSKLTDFLSFNSDFFIVSPRVIAILKDFKMPPNKQFDCVVRHREKKYPYVVLYFFRNAHDFTDYEKSSFTLRYVGQKDTEQAIFNSKREFEKAKKEAYLVLTHIIYALRTPRIPSDLFRINRHQIDYFISGTLRQSFIQNKITGIDYLQNVDTVFSKLNEREILMRHKEVGDYFLKRTAYYSNGILCRQFDKAANVIGEFTRSGKKERELIFQRGKFIGSERTFFANGNVRLEKLVRSRHQVYRYYFINGKLNYEIAFYDKGEVVCNGVFDFDGKELKGYKLSKGTGRILHFNSSGRGGRELIFKDHNLTKEVLVP